MFGWQIAGLYLLLGLLIAVFAGLVIGSLGMEDHLEDWVRELQNSGTPGNAMPADMGWGERIDNGFSHVREIVGKVWLYIVIGVALGTVLAFMMSVIALSAPEMIILRKVLKPRLIATFAAIVATGILLVGFIFNLVL